VCRVSLKVCTVMAGRWGVPLQYSSATSGHGLEMLSDIIFSGGSRIFERGFSLTKTRVEDQYLI